MASTLVRGKYIICKVMSATSAEVISDGAVFQRDGEIIEIGKYDDLRVRYTADEVIGSPNYVVLPGLINTHFHVGLTPFQLGAPDLPLELWMPFRIGARDVDPYLSNLYGAVQMITSGTTTVGVLQVPNNLTTPVKLDTVDKTLKAFQDSGIRVTYGTLMNSHNYMVVGARGGEEDFALQLPTDLSKRFESSVGQRYFSTEEHLSDIQELFTKYGGNRYERIRIILAPSNVHRCSDDLLLAVKQLAKQHKTAINIHVQETVYQKLYGLHAWGKTPLQHLNDLGFLGPEVTCSHCVWVTDEDIDVIAETGTNVCHLASSNLRLQSGIAPVNRLLERGVRIALGTDEAGLNDDKDMLQEMRLVMKLHREPGIENTPPTAYQTLQMATINGALNCQYGDRVGTLEAGKRADMVLINLHNIEEPYLEPGVSIVDAVVQRGRSVDVETVMIDGEVVLRDHRLTRIDSESLFKELKQSLSRPLLPHEIERKELSRQLEPYLKPFYARTLDRMPSPHYYYNGRS